MNRSSLFALCLSAAMMFATHQARAESVFTPFTGSWEGAGTAEFSAGREKIKCRATNDLKADGQLWVTIQCASAGNTNLHIKAHLKESGGRLSGPWDEKNFQKSGTVHGTVRGNDLHVTISSQSVRGSLAIKRKDGSLTVETRVEDVGGFNVALASR